MPNRTTESVWERQKNESQQAYEAFVAYRDLGAERSTAKVAQRLGKSKALIQRWCSRYDWVERARAYDNFIDDGVRREALKKYKDMNARHIKLALQLQQKALKAMEELPDDALSPKDIVQFIDKAIAIEKMTRKEEAGVNDAGKATPGPPGTGGLADLIAEAYKRRKEGDGD